MSKRRLVQITSLIIPAFAAVEYGFMSFFDILANTMIVNAITITLFSFLVGQVFYSIAVENKKIEDKQFENYFGLFCVATFISIIIGYGISKGFLDRKDWTLVMFSCLLSAPFFAILIDFSAKKIKKRATSLLLMPLFFVCSNSFAAKSLEAVAKSAEQKTSNLALALAPVGLIISAFFFFLGKEDGKQKAAMALMGTVIVVSAGSVVSWVKALF